MKNIWCFKKKVVKDGIHHIPSSALLLSIYTQNWKETDNAKPKKVHTGNRITRLYKSACVMFTTLSHFNRNDWISIYHARKVTRWYNSSITTRDYVSIRLNDVAQHVLYNHKLKISNKLPGFTQNPLILRYAHQAIIET